jgi:hypothetical protein
MRNPGWKRDFMRLRRLEDITYRAPYTEERLQAARSEADPLADRVIARLYETCQVRKPDDLLRAVRERAASEGGVYREFLDACSAVPEWADFAAMRQGQRLIASYGPLMGLSLLTGSLVGGYVFYKAAKVTQWTGRLGMPGDISRRLVETSALVFYMSRPDEIRPGGKAHETLVRVRLLHAAIRRWIADSGRWRAEWDVPINQEDLAITFSEFSFINMRNLLRMGVRLSDAQIDSHFALWRYAGHVLGMRDEWLPATFEQEVAQFLPMLKRGMVGARVILDEIADKGPPLLPRALRRKFLYQVTAHLVGDDLVEGLRLVRQRDYPGLSVLFALGAGFSTLHRLPLGERALHALGQHMFQRQLDAANRQRRIGYAVHTHDRDAVRRAHAAHAASLARGSSPKRCVSPRASFLLKAPSSPQEPSCREKSGHSSPSCARSPTKWSSCARRSGHSTTASTATSSLTCSSGGPATHPMTPWPPRHCSTRRAATSTGRRSAPTSSRW